ncbi:MAG: chitosanase [Pseudolysinimonas sp.]
MANHIGATVAAITLTIAIAGCTAGPVADPGGPATASTSSPTPSNHIDLDDPRIKEIAMSLVSTAENSSTDWRAQYSYIEDIGDGRGYTAGIIGFCSGTGDMLELVRPTRPPSPATRSPGTCPPWRR